MEEVTKHRLKIASGIIIGILVIGAIVILVRGRGGEKTADEGVVDTTYIPAPEAPVETSLPAPAPIEQLPPKDSVEQQLKRFSIDFVARFGTYSSDGQSANLKQIMPVLTGAVKTWAEGIVKNTGTGPGQQSFSGVTTKALSAKIISDQTNTAIVEVSTQRMFVEGDNSRVVYEIATITVEKSGSSWLVSSVTWAPKPE